jgi:TP901 family phage tail tape measure protein
MATNGTKRPAEIVLDAETRKLRRDLAAAKGEIRGFGKDAAGSIRSTIGTAFAGALSLASLGGAVSVVKDVVANERALTRLGIQAEVSDERVRALSSNIFQISDSTGQLTSELIAGATELVTLTGDFNLAEKSASALGVAATATGADMRDLAGVSAALSQNMGIAGSKIGGALDILAVQGKQGAVELKDLAGLLPTASAGFKKFGEDGERGVAVLGAALQVSKTATGTASEAATAFNALGKSLAANASRIKKLSGGKVKVFEIDKDGRKVARDFVAILEDLRASKLARDPEALQKALGTEEAVKSFQAISDNWAKFQALIAAGLHGGGTIASDFKRYIESPAGRIERAWARASNALQRAVTPERVELLARATEKFAEGLGFAVDHAGHLVALFGSLKVAQFSLATNRWAQAMGGVATSTARVSGAIRTGAVGLTGMASGTSRLVVGLSQALAHAGGLASVFTASFAATSMLVDAAFEDTQIVATADDPDKVAGGAEALLGKVSAERSALLNDKKNLERMLALPGERFGDAGRRARLGEVTAKLHGTGGVMGVEDEFQHRRTGTIATKVIERDKARGTDALGGVVEILGAKAEIEEQLARLGSATIGGTGASLPDLDREALARYAPEAQNLAGEQLTRVIALLEQSLRQQERLTALQERVTGRGPTREPPPPIRAPRTGTTPR